VDRAASHLETAIAILARHPHAEPAAFRAMWPLLLAAAGDPRAQGAVAQARHLGVDVWNLNRGLIGYAEALLTGIDDPAGAAELAVEADHGFVNAATWRALARILAAPGAGASGWGDPGAWLTEGSTLFAGLGLPGLVELCGRGPGSHEPDRWELAGITTRERDVLELVAGGLANKEIAAHLHLSARTVEKHVEALLRKTMTRSRTQLAMWAAEDAGQPPMRSR
jgi:DNA-binding CsgD family transcriptional regulator